MRRIVLHTLLCCAIAMPALAQEARPLSKGESLYLPIYSHMLYGNVDKKGWAPKALLSAMVSVRNTDAKRSLKLVSARYYDTQGTFLREYLVAPVSIVPFGTHELLVDLHDTSGGSGANFLLRWEADAAMNPPLVEAIHANMDGGKAVIFTTRALPVQTQ